MGANPMQKMKRNSILTGLIIGLVVGLILCALVYLFLTQNTNGSAQDGEIIAVSTLLTDVKSGEKITFSNIITKTMKITDIPADAITLTTEDAVAKIDLSAGTVLGASMLNMSGETLTDDLREQEYNMITLPTDLAEGDFIDIRLQLPNGGDYIVISKKEVLKCNSSTVWLNMYEEEIEIMSCAIIEYYIMTGSKLYATTYVEPGLQTASIGTYVPNSVTVDLIRDNPNIKNLITSERYSTALTNIRNSSINSAVNEYSDDAIANIEENIQQEIEALKESRAAYFGALDSAN